MPSEHRLHPTSILFALAGSLKAFLLPAVLLLLTNGRSSQDPNRWNPAGWVNRALPGDVAIANWQFWLLLFLIPATIASLLKYFSFRLRYEGTELVIRSGVIFRNERHVPYARIQNLDAVRNLAHRLFGVAEVRVETGGGQTPEATISVLHETVFEEMRRRVFEGRAGAVHEEEPARPAAGEAALAQTLLFLPVRELLLNGLLHNRGMVLVAAAASVVWEAGLFNALSSRLAGGAFRPGLVRDAVRPLMAGDMLAFLVRVGVLFAAIVLILAFVRVLSMAWSVVRLHGFRLTRAGEDLRTEYGLLTRVTATIPLKRIQSLTIWETPLQRLVKRQSVRVETAGGHGSPQGGAQGGTPKQPREWLAPIIRRDAVPALVREILPGFDLDRGDWQPLHPRAFRRAVKPMGLLGVVLTAPLIYWLGWAGLLFMPFTVGWLAIMTWMHVRHTQWSVTGDTLVLRSGWLWREVVVVPVAKIQVVGRIESPFDRRAAMSGVRVDTAGSASQAHRITIRYLARDTAAALHERLASQTAQTAFRW